MQKTMGEISVYEAILGRRSIRAYSAQKVDATNIRSLIEAAVMAPTAMGLEPWAFAITQDVTLLKELSDAAKPKFIEQSQQDAQVLAQFRDPAFNIFYDASTLIVICANKETPSATADCWLAAQNLMLAAFAMGLGSCVIGAALSALEEVEQKLKLGITEGFEAVAPIIVGFPREECVGGKRKRPVVLNWIKKQHVH